ncbi:hypothetical protein [Mycobacterium sp. 141]|uniref:hypothetical protein n=1 Tax=Mycobacterium sp. 141 TaxID=1120797 RepID=UPI000382015F|nr:hypothetical protein [Mycobacterium sp. 141]
MSATVEHRCDSSADPRGGLLTLSRVIRTIVDCMNGQLPEVISEIDTCQKCRTLFAINISGVAAAIALEHNPDSRMGYEMSLAAVQAAIERGES